MVSLYRVIIFGQCKSCCIGITVISLIPPLLHPLRSKHLAHIMSEKRNFNYEKDERVLCYHGPLLYEAKVSKT